jgi:hypothetical protein
MATGYDIVGRALRIARVVDAGDALDANDAQDALTTLNAMLAEWHEAEIGLPDYSLATLETELASDAADREAVAFALAERVAMEYGTELSPMAQQMAQATMQRLRLRYFQPGRVSTALPYADADWRTGETE